MPAEEQGAPRRDPDETGDEHRQQERHHQAEHEALLAEPRPAPEDMENERALEEQHGHDPVGTQRVEPGNGPERRALTQETRDPGRQLERQEDEQSEVRPRVRRATADGHQATVACRQ